MLISSCDPSELHLDNVGVFSLRSASMQALSRGANDFIIDHITSKSRARQPFVHFQFYGWNLVLERVWRQWTLNVFALKPWIVSQWWHADLLYQWNIRRHSTVKKRTPPVALKSAGIECLIQAALNLKSTCTILERARGRNHESPWCWLDWFSTSVVSD